MQLLFPTLSCSSSMKAVSEQRDDAKHSLRCADSVSHKHAAACSKEIAAQIDAAGGRGLCLHGSYVSMLCSPAKNTQGSGSSVPHTGRAAFPRSTQCSVALSNVAKEFS